MYVDLLNSNNYLSINLSLIQLVGLQCAVYISELFNIQKKAKIKKVLEEEHYLNLKLKNGREYIEKRTTIPVLEQHALDEKLVSLNLMSIKEDDPDAIFLDTAAIVALIAEGDSKDIEAVKNTFKKMTQSEIIDVRYKLNTKALIKKIKVKDEKVKDALKNWVIAICNKNNGMDNKAFETFQTNLFNYAKNDMALALQLVDIATANCWINFEWAKNEYEKNVKKNNGLPRRTVQVKGTKEELESSTFDLF